MAWGPFPCSGKQGFDRKKKAEEGVLQRPHLQLTPPRARAARELSAHNGPMSGKKNVSGCLLWVCFGWQWVLWSHRITRPGSVGSMVMLSPGWAAQG